MKSTTKFVGLDVSKDSISVAVADAGQGPVRFLGNLPNTPEAVRKLVGRLDKPEELLVCYEAGPMSRRAGEGLPKPETPIFDS